MKNWEEENMFTPKVYLIIKEGTAYYSFMPAEDIDCWEANPEYVSIWLAQFPELLKPQTIH